MAVRRQRVGISRQDSRLSVKSLIESIEKSQQHVSGKLHPKNFGFHFLFFTELHYRRPKQMDLVQCVAQRQA